MPSEDPILPAVLHTLRAFDLDVADFERFLKAMAMDLCRSGYGTYQDLLGYMEGSAAAIGTMMTPILEADDLVRAREYARQLGFAFQLLAPSSDPASGPPSPSTAASSTRWSGPVTRSWTAGSESAATAAWP